MEMGNFWFDFTRNCKWALEDLIHFWPITLGMLINLALAAFWNWPFEQRGWRPQYTLTAILFLFPAAMIAIGVLGAAQPYPPDPPKPNEFALIAFWALIIVNWILCV